VWLRTEFFCLFLRTLRPGGAVHISPAHRPRCTPQVFMPIIIHLNHHPSRFKLLSKDYRRLTQIILEKEISFKMIFPCEKVSKNYFKNNLR